MDFILPKRKPKSKMEFSIFNIKKNLPIISSN